jgi:hypothetical protein
MAFKESTLKYLRASYIHTYLPYHSRDWTLGCTESYSQDIQWIEEDEQDDNYQFSKRQKTKMKQNESGGE